MNSPKSIVRPSIAWSSSTRLFSVWCDIEPQWSANEGEYLLAEAIPGCRDWREKIRPKVSPDFDPTFRPVPYYQVFADRNGFLPNLSIVDLLFNLGPESRLILRDSIVATSEK